MTGKTLYDSNFFIIFRPTRGSYYMYKYQELVGLNQKLFACFMFLDYNIGYISFII